MLHVRRTFEGEKHQLQELNTRLAQYLSRTKQLEHENAHLITEINKVRQTKTVEREHRYKDEVRELRRMVGQLSFEKNRAEMEREKLWREFQAVQSVRREESETCKGVDGDLKGCEKELHGAHQHNVALEQRLFQLESEYKHLDEAHRQQIGQLRHQVDAHRAVVPVVYTQTYHGPHASMEDVQEYAQSLSEGWIDTFEMYQHKVEEMEQAIREDQARLDDLQREKMLYASEFNKLHVEVERQSKIQMHLEGQLVNMQDNFRRDFNQYQMIVEELENERNMLADGLANKMRDYQHLLQVKMDLGMEVAAYRALMEGERVDMQEVNRRVNRHQRERIIDIKLPSQPYTPRASTTSTRQHMDVRYSEQTSNLRAPAPRSGTISPSRVIPISVMGRALHQGSSEARRDMVSFTKAQAAASAATTVDKTMTQTPSRYGEGPQKTAASQPVVKDTFIPITSPTAEPKVRVVSPPMMSFNRNTEADAKSKVRDKPEEKGKESAKPGEKKPLDSPMVEQIIQKVMKPAGMDSAFGLSGDAPQMTYHVEKIEQEDGTTKTQIILESKVEEEVDLSEDFALEELLSRGVKKVSLEDIKGTPTGTMIQNLLSGLQGAEDLVNKSVNVEIIEEPVDSLSDEEYEVEEYEAEEKPLPGFLQASKAVFQIEELENVPQNQKSGGDAKKSSETNRGTGQSVRVLESSRENDSPYFSHDQDPEEYFVSTPDETLSEPEDVGGITSYGHYGMVDDLSDERYYQDEGFPTDSKDADEYKFMSSDHSFVRESIPECIIEEEVHVSPTVQESMLEMFKQDSSLNPKEQLKGALDRIQGSVSGSLKDELAFFTKVSSDSSQNVAVRNVQQSSDNGTTTITAELTMSESLQESGLLEADDDDLSEEQIMAALRASNPSFQKALQSGAEGGYSMRISKHEDVTHIEGLEGESVPEISEKHIQLGPSEAQSFTFQMDVNNGQAQASSERALQSHMGDTPLKISHEKRVATVYLDSSTDN